VDDEWSCPCLCKDPKALDTLGRRPVEPIPPHHRKSASSSAAKKVMDWFRRKGSSRTAQSGHTSISKNSHVEHGQHEDGLLAPGVMVPSAASLRVEAGCPSLPAQHRPRLEETAQPSLVTVLSSDRSAMMGPDTSSAQPLDGSSTFASLEEGMLRYHTGIVDQATLTTMNPSTIMEKVHKTLIDMGIEAKKEGDAKLRCVRLRHVPLPSSRAGNPDQSGLSMVSGTVFEGCVLCTLLRSTSADHRWRSCQQ